MAKRNILVDLTRCTGCWACSVACKVAYDLDPDDFRVSVRTLGNGGGIDQPGGEWPNLYMRWMPIYHTNCTMCGDRDVPYCVECCPSKALTLGDATDEQSEISEKINTLAEAGKHIFELPDWENAHKGIIYASRD